jgi:hypothetical protein
MNSTDFSAGPLPSLPPFQGFFFSDWRPTRWLSIQLLVCYVVIIIARAFARISEINRIQRQNGQREYNLFTYWMDLIRGVTNTAGLLQEKYRVVRAADIQRKSNRLTLSLEQWKDVCTPKFYAWANCHCPACTRAGT